MGVILLPGDKLGRGGQFQQDRETTTPQTGPMYDRSRFSIRLDQQCPSAYLREEFIYVMLVPCPNARIPACH